MAVNIVMPIARRGNNDEMVKIIEWKAKEGDKVKQGDIVVIGESEKAVHDLDAETDGFLHIIAPLGTSVKVKSVVGVIAATKAELEALQKAKK